MTYTDSTAAQNIMTVTVPTSPTSVPEIRDGDYIVAGTDDGQPTLARVLWCVEYRGSYRLELEEANGANYVVDLPAHHQMDRVTL